MIKLELGKRVFEIHTDNINHINQISSLNKLVKEFNRISNGLIYFPERCTHDIICKVLGCVNLDTRGLTDLKMMSDDSIVACESSSILLHKKHVKDGKNKSIFYKFENIDDLKNILNNIKNEKVY